MTCPHCYKEYGNNCFVCQKKQDNILVSKNNIKLLIQDYVLTKFDQIELLLVEGNQQMRQQLFQQTKQLRKIVNKLHSLDVDDNQTTSDWDEFDKADQLIMECKSLDEKTNSYQFSCPDVDLDANSDYGFSIQHVSRSKQKDISKSPKIQQNTIKKCQNMIQAQQQEASKQIYNQIIVNKPQIPQQRQELSLQKQQKTSFMKNSSINKYEKQKVMDKMRTPRCLQSQYPQSLTQQLLSPQSRSDSSSISRKQEKHLRSSMKEMELCNDKANIQDTNILNNIQTLQSNINLFLLSQQCQQFVQEQDVQSVSFNSIHSISGKQDQSDQQSNLIQTKRMPKIDDQKRKPETPSMLRASKNTMQILK